MVWNSADTVGDKAVCPLRGRGRVSGAGLCVSYGPGTGNENPHAKNSPEDIFLLILLVGPPAILVIGQALLGFPFYSVGYDLYCAVALYIIAGGVVSRLSGAVGTTFAVILIALVRIPIGHVYSQDNPAYGIAR